MQKSDLKKLIGYGIGAAVLVLADQLTKIAAVAALQGKPAIVLVPGVLELSYLENTGAAWGMLAGGRIFFLTLTILVVAAISVAVTKIPSDRKYRLLRVTCTLLAGGALGNFIDRFQLRYVRDFIYFRIINFPVFNVADICVSISVILLIVGVFFVYKEDDLAFLKIAEKGQHHEKRDRQD